MLKKALIPLSIGLSLNLGSGLSFGAEPGFGPAPGATGGIRSDFSGESAVNRRPEFEPGFEEPRFIPKVLPDLKDLPEQTMAEAPPAGPTVTLDTIVLQGSTVLRPDEVEATIQPYLNKALSPEDLQSLRRELTLLYLSKGYVNSGVILPNQILQNGTLIYQAIEGRLTDIEVQGNKHLSSDYVAGQVRTEIADPLTLLSVQQGIRKLESDPLVERINGQLIPGRRPGEARLDLTLEEHEPLSLRFQLDNHKSPAVGAEQASVTLQHLNLTGIRDQLIAQAAVTEGLRTGYLAYRLPLLNHRAHLGLYYARDDSEVIEEPFDRLDIEGESENWGLSFDYRLRDRLSHQLTAFIGIDHAASETELDDRPFSFSSGARRGESVSDSVHVGLESIHRWTNQILAIRVSARKGVDIWDATRIPGNAPTRQPDTGEEIPESDFLVWLTQLQFVQRLDLLNSQVVVNATRQDAMDPLLSVDKFAIGGAATVRGFRENALVRDNGMVVNLEWRVPLLQQSADYRAWNLRLIPFFDYGRSWDEDSKLSTHEGAKLTSIGLGLTATPLPNLNTEIFYGHTLEDDDYETGQDWDLQDEGIHFALSYTWVP